MLLKGDRIERLGVAARYDVMMCEACDTSWYAYFDDKGTVWKFGELEHPRVAVRADSRPSGWKGRWKEFLRVRVDDDGREWWCGPEGQQSE